MAAKDPLDDESRAIIYQGASIPQLAMMFKADPKVVTRKVSGLIPVGRRSNTNIYSVAEAAARLVKPGVAIERYIMDMNQNELPALLSKEFWNGKRARQQYEENAGDLWRTADVVTGIGEVFQTLRMSLMLMSDAVERETSLTDTQRIALRRLIDGAQKDMRDKLKERFGSHGFDGNSFQTLQAAFVFLSDFIIREDDLSDEQRDSISGLLETAVESMGPEFKERYQGNGSDGDRDGLSAKHGDSDEVESGGPGVSGHENTEDEYCGL